MSFGYRDKLDLSTIAPPLRDRIVALESRAQQDVDELKEKVRKIDEALAGAVTHMCVEPRSSRFVDDLVLQTL